MRQGFFLTFEGLDGAGKSTQLRRLASVLERQGELVTVTRQPGGTRFGDRIRSLLVESKGEAVAEPASVSSGEAIDPRAEMALMFADRAQTIAEVIAPALERGEIVLCDRFTDSTEAYQGGGRELGASIVHALHTALCGGLQPDLTLLLLPPFEASLARARRRNQRHLQQHGRDEGRFERESEAFFRRVYEQYLAIAAREPVRVVVVDGDRSIEQTHASIVETVVERLAQHRRP